MGTKRPKLNACGNYMRVGLILGNFLYGVSRISCCDHLWCKRCAIVL